MELSRRDLLKYCSLTLGSLAGSFVQAQGLTGSSNPSGNFHFIYNNPEFRQEFYRFLANVFHLYPEDQMHELILSTNLEYGNDRQTYQQLQLSLSEISPFLANFTYALPALSKQKKAMSTQTKLLLPDSRSFEGYLEIGSTGRYIDALEEKLDINGERFFISERKSTYSLENMIDRGQILKAGKWINLNNYETNINQVIPGNSIDLATVYIGFHHCPLDLREEFIGSLRDVMKADGFLILRDHDARNDKMQHLTALAHDVFNMGTNESWAYNKNELRNFYSLDELDLLMRKFGFKSNGNRLLQDGDPTLNSLMLYKKA